MMLIMIAVAAIILRSVHLTWIQAILFPSFLVPIVWWAGRIEAQWMMDIKLAEHQWIGSLYQHPDDREIDALVQLRHALDLEKTRVANADLIMVAAHLLKVDKKNNGRQSRKALRELLKKAIHDDLSS
jgi:hypothetical protein